MRERMRAPRRLGGLNRRLAAAAAVAMLVAGPCAAPAFAEAKPAASGTGVAGDVDGDGSPDLVNAQGNNLVVLPPHGAPYTASTAGQSPEGRSWAQYQVSDRGSLTGTKTDGLYVFSPVTHTLYAYPNDADSGGTPGRFTHPDKAVKVTKPAGCATGADCAGYDPTWNSTTQVLATNGVDNGDGLPDVVTVENGRLWYYPGKAGSLLGDPVPLGTGDWSATTLMAPGSVAGTPTLWAREPVTGAIASYPLAFNADGTAVKQLAAPVVNALQSAAKSDSGEKLCLTVYLGSLADASCGSSPEQFLLGSDGGVHAGGLCMAAPGAALVQLSGCDGGVSQRWTAGPGGALATSTGQCLTADDATPDDAYTLSLSTCTGAADQRWGIVDPNSATPGPLPATTAVLPVGTNTSGNNNGYTLAGYASPGDLYGDGYPELVVPTGYGGSAFEEYPGAAPVNGLAQFAAPVALGNLASPSASADGGWIFSGTVLYSACARFELLPDGDAVLTRLKTGQVIWSSGTSGHPGSRILVDSTGALEVHDSGNNVIWSTGTSESNNPRVTLTVQDNCNLVLGDAEGNPIWSSRTYDPAYDTTGHALTAGTVLHGGDMVAAADGRTTLTLRTDGDLVLADQEAGHVLWTSGTAGHPGATAAMQVDGNFVLSDASGTPLWASGTWQQPGARTVVQQDGNLVAYNADGKALWSTGTYYGGVDAWGTSVASGTTLQPGDTVNSTAARLVMQTDGNLVLYSKATGNVRWSTGTWGHPGATATMQPDGNVVLYDANHNALWGASTWGHPNAHLVVQNDLNLALYDTQGRPLWATGTANTDAPKRGTVVRAGGVLHSGDSISNVPAPIPSQLTMQSDGNLVLFSTPWNRVVWASGTWGRPGAWADMQTDGNLVVHGSGNQALWSTGTWGHSGAYLVLQQDGNLVVYDADGVALWASHTDYDTLQSEGMVPLLPGH
ncbi:ricin-type beta-trefoil lectin domain protein [Kitasatospora sp. NPDC052896]|uniref:ricin-type beta-trefoil lectin domain protein n=1 Tax=Kitasatospora sp. NPDC052896 TaxID=3364061 RepID=UPI0037C92073